MLIPRSSRWRPGWSVALALAAIVAVLAFHGHDLIAVRKDGVALSRVLRDLWARDGWFAVLSGAVGGYLGWVFRSALIQGGTSAFGPTAAFWLTWSAINIAALLVFTVSHCGVAELVNARPGPIKGFNGFVRRWAVPLVALLGLAPPPLPMAFVLFMVATAGMSPLRFLLPFAAGSAIGIQLNLRSGGTALMDPDPSWQQILVILLLPPMVMLIVARVTAARRRA